MLEDFKKFILKGNVVDLAVAVVIGVAFAAVIDAFVSNIIMPIIGIIGGKPSFDEFTITINKSVIMWGSFVTALVNFLIIAAAIFMAVKGLEKMQNMRKTAADVEEVPELSVSEELLSEIRDLLRTRA